MLPWKWNPSFLLYKILHYLALINSPESSQASDSKIPTSHSTDTNLLYFPEHNRIISQLPCGFIGEQAFSFSPKSYSFSSLSLKSLSLQEVFPNQYHSLLSIIITLSLSQNTALFRRLFMFFLFFIYLFFLSSLFSFS